MQKMRKMSAALGRIVLSATIGASVFAYTGGQSLGQSKAYAENVNKRLSNESYDFNEDSTIKFLGKYTNTNNYSTVGIRGEEHTLTINDGTLTIIGNSPSGIVYADGGTTQGGVLNFRGNGDVVIENIGSSDTQTDDFYGEVAGNRKNAETVYVFASSGGGNGSAVNFYNPNTLIRVYEGRITARYAPNHAITAV